MVLAQSRSGGGGFACLSLRPRETEPTRIPARDPALSSLLAAPAGAAFDWTTQVVDFEFQPAERKISVGDTVTWNFGVDGHTSASLGGQPDSWKSADSGHEPGGHALHAPVQHARAATSTCASSTATS